MNLYRRLLCLLFGHRPEHLEILYADRSKKPADVLTLSIAEGTPLIVLNLCVRCKQLVRHPAREAHLTATLGMQAANALAEQRQRHAEEDKAKAEAASRRQRGESIPAWKLRTGKKS